MLLADLPAYYDDVDPSLVDTISRAATGDLGAVSHFTRRKSIYTAYVNDRPVGFTVATWKRGGAVKTGPTVVLPQHRRSGHARWLKREVNARLLQAGARKLYSTVAADNWRMLMLTLQLGFEVEGILSDQYRAGTREVVFGRFGAGKRTVQTGEPLAPRRHAFRTVGGDDRAEPLLRPDVAELSGFLLPRLAPAFEDLDETFVQTVVDTSSVGRTGTAAAATRHESLVVVSRTASGLLSGAGVCVAKRGGSIKLCPLVADSREAAERVVDRCVEHARTRGHRKVYSITPLCSPELAAVLQQRGFKFEARLREPYKAGIDAVVLSRPVGT